MSGAAIRIHNDYTIAELRRSSERQDLRCVHTDVGFQRSWSSPLRVPMIAQVGCTSNAEQTDEVAAPLALRLGNIGTNDSQGFARLGACRPQSRVGCRRKNSAHEKKSAVIQVLSGWRGMPRARGAANIESARHRGGKPTMDKIGAGPLCSWCPGSNGGPVQPSLLCRIGVETLLRSGREAC